MNDELPRTPIPQALLQQALVMGVEPPLFYVLVGGLGLILYTATAAWYNAIIGPAIVIPIYLIVRKRTEKDPFFFRIYRQTNNPRIPPCLPAVSGVRAPEEPVSSWRSR